MERRAALGGPVPAREVEYPHPTVPDGEFYEEFARGSKGRAVSTTMAAVQVISKLLRDKEIGKLHRADRARRGPHLRHGRARAAHRHLQPARPDLHARRQRLADGLQGERTTARCWKRASPRTARWRRWIAAGTAYATTACRPFPSSCSTRCSVCSAWATSCGPPPTSAHAASCWAPPPGAPPWPARACSTRTATAMLQAYVVPNLKVYDPAFAYELAVIIESGIQRMYVDASTSSITSRRQRERSPARHARRWPQPSRKFGDGIVKGMYLFQRSQSKKAKLQAQLLASGPAMGAAQEAVRTARGLRCRRRPVERDQL